MHSSDSFVRWRPLTAILMAISMLLAVLAAAPTHATPQQDVQAGATYYVDSTCLNDCDANDGLSEDSPWHSLARVNSHQLEPGDTVRFKAGGEWTGFLWPKGSGSEDLPITISSYGEGQKPRIDGAGRESVVVYLANVEHYIVENLDVRNTADSPGTRGAIRARNMTGGVLRGIVIRNNSVSDVRGIASGFYASNSGIAVTSDIPDSVYEGVEIYGNTVSGVDRVGIYVGPSVERYGAGIPDYRDLPKNTGVHIHHNTLTDLGADGILTYVTEDALIEHNLIDGHGLRQTGDCQEAGYCNGASVGIWMAAAPGTTIQYNEVTGGKGHHDGEAFDIDWGSDNVTVQYNYSHGNPGFMLFVVDQVSIYGARKPRQNNSAVVRYNISQNDYATDAREISAIFRAGDWLFNVDTPLQITNNVFYLDENADAVFLSSKSVLDRTLNGDFLFANNIIYNLGNLAYQNNQGQWTNNLFYGNHHETEPLDPFKITSDPLLVDPGTGGAGFDSLGGYAIKDGSPAAAAGTMLPLQAETDFFGNPVGDQQWNVGVDQAVRGVQTNAPTLSSTTEGSAADAAQLLGATFAAQETARSTRELIDLVPHLAASGVTTVRLERVLNDDTYGIVSTSGGGLRYDFSRLDAVLDAFEEHGITPRIDLAGDAAALKTGTQLDPVRWTLASTAVIRHVTARGFTGLVWEVWDGADSSSPWSGSATTYAVVHALVRTLIRSVDRSAHVALGLHSADPTSNGWLRNYTALARWLSPLRPDEVSLRADRSTTVGSIEDAASFLSANGLSDAQLSVTGWSPVSGTAEAATGADSDGSQAAARAVEFFDDALASGVIRHIFHAQVTDTRRSQEPLSGDIGLFSVEGRPKALANSMRAFATLGSGSTQLLGSNGVASQVSGRMSTDPATGTVAVVLANTDDTDHGVKLALSDLPFDGTFTTEVRVIDTTRGGAHAVLSYGTRAGELAPVVARQQQPGSDSWQRGLTLSPNSVTQVILAAEDRSQWPLVAVNPRPVNVAQGAVVTASSTLEGTDLDWSADHLTDAIRTTRGTDPLPSPGWSSAYQPDADTPVDITVDFRSVQTIDTVTLWPRTDGQCAGTGFPSTFTIEAAESAEGPWTMLAQEAGYSLPAHGPQSFSFAAGEYRLIRATATTLGQGCGEEGHAFQLSEIEAQLTRLGNPGFEQDSPEPWVLNSGSEIVADGARTGTQALRLAADGSASVEIEGLQPATRYIVTVHARSLDGGQLTAEITDFGGTDVAVVGSKQAGYEGVDVRFTSGWRASSATLTVSNTTGGSVLIDDASVVSLDEQVQMADPRKRVLFDFEDGTEGWEAGTNVAALASVTDWANGGKPAPSGVRVLEATASPAHAEDWRTISVNLDSPLDLSHASSLDLQINSYGGAGGSGYEARLTLTNSSGDTLSVTEPTFANQWAPVSIDLSSWDGRSSLTTIEVSFRAVGADRIWQEPRFQIDDVSYRRTA